METIVFETTFRDRARAIENVKALLTKIKGDPVTSDLAVVVSMAEGYLERWREDVEDIGGSKVL